MPGATGFGAPGKWLVQEITRVPSWVQMGRSIPLVLMRPPSGPATARRPSVVELPSGSSGE